MPGLRIDFVCNEPHYLSHLALIWWGLPSEVRGTFWAPGYVARQAERQGIIADTRHPDQTKADIVVGAAWRDIRRVTKPKRVLIEHGAGQSYRGTGVRHPAYYGGEGRERLDLHLVPRPEMVETAREVWIGNPRLDLLGTPQEPLTHYKKFTVGCTWHWNCGIAPEAGTAFYDFEHVLKRLPQVVDKIVGTSHPRLWPEAQAHYQLARIPSTERWEDLLDVDMLITDNTSVMYEFAAHGKPVICCNAKHWRKHVEHGLRFWGLVPGPQVDDPEQLCETIWDVAGSYPFWSRHAYKTAVRVYGEIGGATRRAVEAILRVS